jgi:hypothetical protein
MLTATGGRELLGDIMRYEDGDMTEEEVITFFQALIDSGLVWQLQGSYGRTAQRLIDAGLIKGPHQ